MLKKVKHSVSVLDDSLWLYKNVCHPDFKIPSKSWTKNSFFLRVLSSFFSIFKKVFTLRKSRHRDINAEGLLYINSHNTNETLKFLASEGYDKFKQVSSFKNNDFIFSIKDIMLMPIAYIYALKVDFSFYFFYPDFFFENWGKYESNLAFLKEQKSLHIVFFANDHNVHNRLFLSACISNKIKTIYLQHAPVSKYFPPLKFNHAFLFGEVDFNIYSSIGVGENVKVTLVGMPSFDKYHNLRKTLINTPPRVIGVSVNLFDDLSKLKKLISNLTKNYKIIVRFHPRDQRVARFLLDNIELSDSLSESSFDYLAKLDLHIAGDSGIHLESILMNVPSFYYKMSIGTVWDYYKFLHYKVIKEVTDLNNFDEMLDLNDVYMSAKPFCASVGEVYEGKVQKYILKLIEKIKQEQVGNNGK